MVLGLDLLKTSPYRLRVDALRATPQSWDIYYNWCLFQTEKQREQDKMISFQSQASVQPYDPSTYFFHKVGSSFNQVILSYKISFFTFIYPET